MNLGEMKLEIIRFRSNSNLAIYIANWIHAAYMQVWTFADWPFKEVYGDTLNAFAGNSRGSGPSNLRRVRYLADPDGNELSYLTPKEYAATWRNQDDRGTPTTYTVVNRTVFLGPIPRVNVNLTLDYERAMYHLSGVGIPTEGRMIEDDATPAWDEDHHYLLVPRAMALGLKEENDPTWQALEADFETQLAVMASELLPPDMPGNRQVGADPL